MRPAVIRQYDRLPQFQSTATDKNGPVNFTVFVTLEFRMTQIADRTHVIHGPGAGDAVGNLSYDWQIGDTDVAGMYEAVFVGTDMFGREQTFPTDGVLAIYVEPRPENK